MFKKVATVFIVLFVVIQFIPVDKKNPPVDPQQDFFYNQNVNAETKQLIIDACYDCHSNTTVYPWYSKIAPVSIWLKNHVDEGKTHLNFSTWSDYSIDKKNHKLEECYEETEEKHMPLKSYTWTHSEARLSDKQIAKIVEYFKSRIQ